MTIVNKGLSWLYLILIASALLMITMGARQSQGLFVFPMAGSTGVSIVTISFAMAVGQFMWGSGRRWPARSPTASARREYLLSGVLVLAVGTALTPFLTTASVSC